MRFLGIDPGTTRIGYGLIEDKSGQFIALKYELLDLNSLKRNGAVGVGEAFDKLIKKLKPDVIAIEELFFTKNQKTAISVAESRGVIKFLALKNNFEVREYNPLEVKLALTSDGRADKIAVGKMVKKILNLEKINGPDDVSDALAIALTAAMRYKMDSY
jgi:crossover junction endodeoxyribonuclease RuvC